MTERTQSTSRYRLLETMRQYGEEQTELRDETSILRDRHARFFSARALELGQLVDSARQVEGSRIIDVEWSNLRAAHLWALATSDLDQAENIVRATFYDAEARMRAEHKSWTLRTVDLGIELGRPSPEMIGFHAFWLSIDGFEAESFEWGRRGIEAAPTPDDPFTAQCWSMLSGAGPLTPHGASEVRIAFEAQRRAVANYTDPERSWRALIDLADSAMNADPATVEPIRQQLHQIAERVGAPTLVIYCALLDGHMLVDPTGASHDHTGARAAYERALDVARDGLHLQFETQALRAMALAATGQGAPDAIERCREAIEALYEIRYWQKLWQTLESTNLALAEQGRTADAAVLLGHLDAHLVGAGIESGLGYRDRGRSLIALAGGHPEAIERGSNMSNDQLVQAALAFCTSTQT